MGFKSGHSLRVSRETDDDSVRCCFRLKRRLDSPLGILNLLSFLYHKHPRSVFTILTGNSESGQSDVFRVKSVAAARRRKTSSWVWQTADSVAVVFYSLCRWILSSDHNLCLYWPMNLFSAGRWRSGLSSKSPAQRCAHSSERSDDTNQTTRFNTSVNKYKKELKSTSLFNTPLPCLPSTKHDTIVVQASDFLSSNKNIIKKYKICLTIT